MPSKPVTPPPSADPSKAQERRLLSLEQDEEKDKKKHRRLKWFTIISVILLILFIIFRCQILRFIYNTTGVNLVYDCPDSGLSLKNILPDLSGDDMRMVVANEDGSLTTAPIPQVVVPTPDSSTVSSTQVGIQGLPGPQGPQGLVGPAGPQGAQGNSGNSGSNGSNGTNGSNGATGPAGAVGPAGPPGPAAPTPAVACLPTEVLSWDGSNFVCITPPAGLTTNLITLDQATGLTSTVNGVVANQGIANSTPVNLIGFDGGGNPVYDSVANILVANTTNTLVNDGVNTLTSTVNGIVASDNIINTNTLSLVGNTVTSTVNGVVSNVIDLSTINPNCTLTGPFFCQDGNTFGATAMLGTNDAFDLAFETNGTEHLRLVQGGRLDFTNLSSSVLLDGGNDTMTGAFNIGIGESSLSSNTTGFSNISIGQNAMLFNTTGNNNVAVGQAALLFNNGDTNTAVGQGAGILSTGNSNVFLGYAAGNNHVSGDNNILIGQFANVPNVNGTNQMSIGNWIYGDNGNIGVGYAFPTAQLHVAGADVPGGNAGLQWEGVTTVPGLSTAGDGRIFFNSNTNQWECSVNGGAYTPCISAFGGAITSINTTALGPNVDIVGTPNEINVTTLGNTVTFSLDPDIVCPGSLTTFCQEGNSFGLRGMLGTNDAFDQAFETNGLERMRLTQTGRMLFSNTSGGNTNLFIGQNTGNETTLGQNNIGIGTDALLTVTSQVNNVAIGTRALSSLSGGLGFSDLNVAVGFEAGRFTTTGEQNVALGNNAMRSNTTGARNVYIGSGSGDTLTSGSNNVGLGYGTLSGTGAGGNENTALGFSSMVVNVGGSQNTALGSSTLRFNTTGSRNISIGRLSLSENVTGSDNLAIGNNSLGSIVGITDQLGIGTDALRFTTVAGNFAVGNYALDGIIAQTGNFAIGNNALTSSLNVANNNFAIGDSVLRDITSGTSNLAIGNSAMALATTSSNNVVVGLSSGTNLSTGSNNVFLGNNTGSAVTTVSGLTFVGDQAGRANTSGTGNTFIGNRTGLVNNTGSNSTFLGNLAGTANTSGSANVAIGALSLTGNSSGRQNVAVGLASMMVYNGSGLEDGNVAIGVSSMSGLTGGAFGIDDRNVAIGASSMRTSPDALDSIAIGNQAMENATGPNRDIAIGSYALEAETTGNGNFAIGYQSMAHSTTAVNNIMIGNLTMTNAVIGQTGSENVGLGHTALRFVNGGGAVSNVAVGNGALGILTSGNSNTTLGRNSGNTLTTGSLNTLIGFDADTSAAGLTNATALGGRAQVNCSNCLVLGSVNGVNGAVADTNVGIGTTSPATTLHLAGGSTGLAGTAGLRMDGVAANPSLSTVGNGRIYFDTTLGLFQCSENGSAYTNCFGGGGGITTADNGLTLTGANVQLGGTLIQDTLIDDDGGGRNLYIGSVSPLAGFYLETTGDNDIVANNISLTAASGISLSLTSALSVNSLPGTVGQVLTSQGAGVPPIWADVTAITTADNGLTLTGSNVQLGGPLIQNTTITNNGFDFIFNGTGNGSGKIATFAGDVDIQGVIDPTALLFSDSGLGSYNPATTNGFKIGTTGGVNRPIYVSQFANTSDTFQVRRADDTTVVFDADSANSSVGVNGQASTYRLTIHDTSTAGVLLTGTDVLFNMNRTATGSVFTMRNNNAGIVHLNANNGATLSFAATTGATTTATQMTLDTNGNLRLGDIDSLANASTPRLRVDNYNASINSVLPVAQLYRDVTGGGAGANGIGGSLDFVTKSTGGNAFTSSRIISVLPDATQLGIDNPEGSLQFNVLVNGVDTEVMRIISQNVGGSGTSGNVGIGTTAPAARLDILDTNDALASDLTGAIRLRTPGGVTMVSEVMGFSTPNLSNAYIGTASNDGFAIRTNDLQRFRIASSGEASLGRGINPQFELTVGVDMVTATDTRSVIHIVNANSGPNSSDGIDIISNTTMGQFVNNDANGFEWHTNAAGVPAVGSLRMNMDQYGNLDLNPDTPGGASAVIMFNVDGQITSANQVGNLTAVNIAPTDGGFSTLGTNVGLKVDVSGLSGGTNYAAILNGGNVGIGNAAPALKLHVGDTSVADGTNLLRLEDVDSMCSWDANGASLCVSDGSLKKNIEDLGSTLDLLNGLHVVSYNWNTDSNGAVKKDGFIAQEVEALFPKLVEEGTWKDGSQKKMLNINGFVPYVIKAIQEQQGLIQAVQDDVVVLKSGGAPVASGGSISPTPSPIPSTTATPIASSEADLYVTKASLEPTVSFGDSLWIFLKEVSFKAMAVFENSVVFLAEVTFKGRFTSEDKDLAGRAVIHTGAKEVQITFEQPYSFTPVVTVSGAGHFTPATVSEVTTDGFKVLIANDATEELNFNWMALAVKDAVTSESSFDSAQDESTVSAPAPSVPPQVTGEPTISPTAEPTTTSETTVTPTPPSEPESTVTPTP